MPRIPAADIERLKQTISVARLAEARGIELKRHGADLIGRWGWGTAAEWVETLTAG